MRKTVFLLLAIILTLAGCGGQTQTPTASSITDDLGNSILLTKTPERIVSLTPNTTEIVYYLGLGGNLVGRSNYCNYPPEVSKVLSIGDPMSLSVEKIVELKPDLVVANRMIPIEILEKIKSLGIIVAAFDPMTVDGVLETIDKIANLCHVQPKTSDLKAELDKYKKPLGSKLVYVEIWNDPPTTYGANTFGSDMVKWVGGKNLGDELKGAYPMTTDEALIKLNPQIVILPTKNDKIVEQFKARKGLDAIDAVKNNQIFAIDEDIISRPGPRILDAINALSEHINP
jgi:iron complex transport system substrate-binding protein